MGYKRTFFPRSYPVRSKNKWCVYRFRKEQHKNLQGKKDQMRLWCCHWHELHEPEPHLGHVVFASRIRHQTVTDRIDGAGTGRGQNTPSPASAVGVISPSQRCQTIVYERSIQSWLVHSGVMAGLRKVLGLPGITTDQAKPSQREMIYAARCPRQWWMSKGLPANNIEIKIQ